MNNEDNLHYDGNDLLDMRILYGAERYSLYLPIDREIGACFLDICDHNKSTIQWIHTNQPDKLWVFDEITGWELNEEEPLSDYKIYAISEY